MSLDDLEDIWPRIWYVHIVLYAAGLRYLITVKCSTSVCSSVGCTCHPGYRLPPEWYLSSIWHSLLWAHVNLWNYFQYSPWSPLTSWLTMTSWMKTWSASGLCWADRLRVHLSHSLPGYLVFIFSFISRIWPRKLAKTIYFSKVRYLVLCAPNWVAAVRNVTLQDATAVMGSKQPGKAKRCLFLDH